MKKVLILMLGLGLATVAQATPVAGGLELSIGGNPAPPVIELEPSDWIELDIHVLPGTVLNGGNLEIVLSNNQGRLDPANMQFYPSTTRYFTFGLWVLEDDAGFGYQYVPTLSDLQKVTITGGAIDWNAENNANLEGPWGGGFIPEVPADSFPVLMDGLMFHCEEATDVEILLYAAGQGITYLTHDAEGNVIGQEIAYGPGELIDSILVIQTPEPMTIALLGLGGLFLRRRK